MAIKEKKLSIQSLFPLWSVPKCSQITDEGKILFYRSIPANKWKRSNAAAAAAAKSLHLCPNIVNGLMDHLKSGKWILHYFLYLMDIKVF